MKATIARWIDLPRPRPADLTAGVSVALILIPQSLAYAQIAEMPAHIGLFASALPCLLFALFASSPYLQTGPVALTSLLTLGALQGAGFDSIDPNYVELGALLALLVGVVRLALGATRLGWIAYLISEPVMMGFTSAAAVIILSSQLPKAFGVDAAVPDSSTLGEAWWALTHPLQWSWLSLVIAGATLTVMLGGRRVHKLFPGVLVAVVAGLLFSVASGYEGPIVGKPTPIPEGMPKFGLDLPWQEVPTLFMGAIVIALVGFAEPSAIARTFAAEDRIPWSANREFISSGLANLGSAISGAMPVGGSFSRSSVNRFAGAKTRWSGGVTGLVVLCFLPFATVLNDLPQAVLGAIVLGAVYGLVRPLRMLRLWTRSKSQAAISWLTFGATLFFAPDIQWAIVVGIILTVVYHFTVTLKLETSAANSASTISPTTTLTPQGLIWLPTNAKFERLLVEAIEANPRSDVTLDLRTLAAIDSVVGDSIASARATALSNGNELFVINAPDGSEAIIYAALRDEAMG